jgi:sensor histidine kinase YesM
VLPIHLAAVPVVSWIANLGVVLGFWWMSGSFGTPAALARQAAFWATIRLHVAALVYGATVALTHGWAYLRDARHREVRVARLETQLNRARFQALNAQIRPHFLFNTLHTIGQLWRSGRADEAEEMLDHLGSLFQRVRSSTDRPGISLAEELSMVQEYLAIEEARYADRLVACVDVTDEARACIVPPLLLQPLVENAIRHGISRSADGGRVDVVADVRDGRLVIEVRDDGPGMEAASATPGSGTGLSNTRERLHHAFGGDATLELASPPAGGLSVRVEIPALRDPDADFWGGP